MGSLYGYEVQSELPLRRLNRAAGGRGTIVVTAGPIEPPSGEPVSTLEEADGERFYASYESPDGCLLVMPPSGAFMLEPERLRVTVETDGPRDELFEHRLASSAICTMLAMRGDLVMHASAVRAGERAVLFCGPTRRGKSTLARTLGGLGHAVIGEDGVDVAFEPEPVAHPGARGVRMRTGAAGAVAVELAADPGPGEPGPCPVATVILLGDRGGQLEIEPLEATRAMALLTPNLIHSGGRDAIAAAFAGLARLLHTVPALRASLPDDFAALPGAARELLDSLPGDG